MKKESIRIDDFVLDSYSLNTLIIGSGAASLKAAVSLHSMGVEDILIATAGWGEGTSNNAGSDKQTYYKLSLAGDKPDSAVQLARDLFSGRCMHGDIALCEAQGSVRAFMHLVALGVKFPHDEYDSFPGYRTDHDSRGRATSAGPYTSRMMFEVLAEDTKRRGIRVLDRHHVIALLTDQDQTKVLGALAINRNETDYKKAFVLFNSVNIVLGTGGPGGIYRDSVYPHSQSGSTGMALEAGATARNLTESQFGIASVGFRWNLSGSYQQVIPRYISTDPAGKNPAEFLNAHFPDIRTLTTAIFNKGYQWPFDPGKIRNYGSSGIDILVDREINERGRRVFLDYSENPSGRGGEIFATGNLDPAVINYLQRSGTGGRSPVERLRSMNLPAYELYREHGIDLAHEKLEIAVCAQHNNGGLKGDIWWESDLKHLFPVGEVNGSHGVYRPGGAALNSGQVGSYRAALRISRHYNYRPPGADTLLEVTRKIVTGKLALAERWMLAGYRKRNEEYLEAIRDLMTSAAGIMRNVKSTAGGVQKALKSIERFPEEAGASSVGDLCNCFNIMDHCITHFVYLKAIQHYIENGGRSRGSYIVTNVTKPEEFPDPEICDFKKSIEKDIIEASYNNKEVRFMHVKPVPIPDRDLWFERIWREYSQDI